MEFPLEMSLNACCNQTSEKPVVRVRPRWHSRRISPDGLRLMNKNAALRFEENQVQQVDEWGSVFEMNRIDLFVEGQGRFEVESMAGSGAMEAFYHQKVFARLKRDGIHSWLVVPNEAVLWAGPYLADLAYHLGSGGSVLIPSAGGAYLKLQGRPLSRLEIEVPWDDLRGMSAISGGETREEEASLRLKDVAGYKEIRERVEELIIWPEKHRRALRRPSRSSGILFFGPPGCGKSRLARAIAGELDQEVRLLSPSDLRGHYVGWGQIMIREQFDWVAQHERRMLVIDEIDAIARSRREGGNMHSDEKANVNELLVQLDRVSHLGRLVVGTTNFVESLDDAVLRSGRFGCFVPVAPPDIDEAVDILNYYLKRLIDYEITNDQPRIQVPEAEELGSILRPLFAENATERRFFCGADLEEAVNRTYQRCLRSALGDDTWPEDYTRVNVYLTSEELTHSLRDVPKSVREEAVEQFIMDIKRYCGSAMASQVEQRLGFEG